MSTDPHAARKTGHEIAAVGVEQAEAMVGEAVVIDVREAHERRRGHIPASVHIARASLEGRIGAEVPDRKTPILVVCATGARSMLAARTLKTLGYERVFNLSGGVNAWKAAGLRWVAGDARSGLSEAQAERYSRHFAIPEVGESGQQKLLASKVVLVGMGALGSSSAFYLAASGIGTIGIVDFDRVDLSNLQRQIIHATDRIGCLKTESAERALRALNPDTRIVRHECKLNSANALEVLGSYDVVVNCSDNFPTRYLVNDACVMLKRPLVDGAIYRFEGNATVYHPSVGGPCYRCLYPQPAPPELAPDCAEAGVLGALPGIIGSVQALEAIKILLGTGEPLLGRMLYLDTLSSTGYTRVLATKKNPDCPVCGPRATQRSLIDYEEFCASTQASP